MAWTYKQARDIAVDRDNIDRVQVAIVTAAIAISSESDATDNHTNRANYANQVLRSPATHARKMIWGVVTDATVQSDPTDSNIYNAIAGQWNAYAGVI